MDTARAMYECCLYLISEEISVRCYVHPARSVFDTHLFIFVTEAIYIRIYIGDYPYSNPNSVENVKTTITSLPAPRRRGRRDRRWCRIAGGNETPVSNGPRIGRGSSDLRRLAVARPAIG